MAEAIDLGRVPVRNGPYYCSPRCGGGKFCRHEWYEAAKRNAEALASRMGEGWEAEVWENLGWHYRVQKGCVTIYVNEYKNLGFDPEVGYPVRSYSAWIQPGIVVSNTVIQIIESAGTPEDALGFAVQAARTAMSRMGEALAALHEVADG
ncbi:MAG: hypothetical protein E5V72_02000 [Mesorhizobium sp.]|uniref:hypothetical protein n=1 Tax=Mesorhizobium sp. TaxID=1871066 RepID=UPI000FE7CD42|nr:hypothetical protein [Mesorhizobium sp.]RWH52192.1 MAG: hypothetical protein EOQ82_27310 [Mesorhizobium sp.]RWI63440.1 MAG: hypothetical protein EOR18_31595 [Mesorhizobium sp.]RWI74825.1 MAG: hypothetical protein EOR19_20285 [Mesorhizobium sp.]RWJ33318.1 MAG: hypothetical protein EOR28_12080 [Mesorhizobium sp.]TIQ65173.1 MAG: hypothetical protein E5X41_13355 [Mesorhizobium sp.]